MKNPKGNSAVVMLTLALAIACMQSAPAQTFKQVKVTGKPAIVQVASGGTSAWALASTGKPYVNLLSPSAMERNLTGATLYLATAPAGATFSQRSLRKSLHCYLSFGERPDGVFGRRRTLERPDGVFGRHNPKKRPT
jgi:hypothetical protein